MSELWEDDEEENTPDIIVLKRDIFAALVPSGARVMLHQGTEVRITQALGSTFTVNVYGNLARIDGQDADALGKTVKAAWESLPPTASLDERVWAQLKTVYDPEIPVNIVDLGLVYRCEIKPAEVSEKVKIEVDMTLTAPGCGMGPVLADDVKQKLLAIPSVDDVEVALVFEPPWDRSRMSEMAQLELGMY